MGGRGSSSGAGGGVKKVSLEKLREYDYDLSIDIGGGRVSATRYKRGDQYNDTSYLSGHYKQRDVVNIIDDYGKTAVNITVKENTAEQWTKRLATAGHTVKMQAPSTQVGGYVELLVEKKGAKIASAKKKKKSAEQTTYKTYKG